MKFVKSALILILTVCVFGAAMLGLNKLTGPIIEANQAGAELAPLLAVMPEGSSFGKDALIYDSANASASSLTGVGETVLKIYREANGKGFAVQMKTSGNYTATDPILLTFGVDAAGKVCGIQLDKYTDTIDVREKDANFLSSFIGQDSTLAGINLIAGCTYSSSAIRNAVSAGMEALAANKLIVAVEKSPVQTFTELLPTVAPCMAVSGILKTTERTPTGSAEAVFVANNDSAAAFVMKENDSYFLAVVHATGAVRVYDIDGNDVTDAHTALSDEAKASAASALKSHVTEAEAKLKRLFKGKEISDITPVTLNTFNTVVYAATFRADGAEYTFFYCRPIGFDQMDLYIVLDANGAIAKFDAKAILFDTEFFPVAGTIEEPKYKAALEGLSPDNFPADAGVITGATMTSNTVRQTISEVFAAFAEIRKGGN